MPIGWTLKQCAQIGVLSILGLPLVAAAQPDISLDREQCSKAKTAQECQVALPACGRALAALGQAPRVSNLDALQGPVLSELARCEQQVGNYPAAEGHYRRALAVRQRLHGPEHTEVASSLNSLADIYIRLGKYEEAETLGRQALAMRQKLLGAQHPGVAQSLNSIALALFGQGKYGAAETLSRQALAMRQKLLGEQHPEVAQSLCNLALALDRLGKFEESERLQRQALEMRQTLLGAEHYDVAESFFYLGSVLAEQGKYEQAERLYRQGLEMMQRLLGAKHPDVAEFLSGLAWVLKFQGKYEVAERLLRQALEIMQGVLGAQHPEVALMLNNLAWVLEKQGKYEEAERLHRRALEIRQKALGPQHPDVAQSLDNVARVLSSQGKYDVAEKLERQALEIRQKVLGPQHPDVALSLNNVASELSSQGKYEAAETLHRQALEIRQKVLGPQHPDVANSLDGLGSALAEQGKYEQAERLKRQALEMRQRLLGAKHPAVAGSLNNLAWVLMSQGNYEAAEPLFRQALEIWHKLLDAQHPNIAQVLSNLALVLGYQGKYEAAEPLQRQALHIRQKMLGPQHPDVAQSLGNLALLLRNQGKYEQAERLVHQALEIRRNQLGPQHPTVAVSLENLAIIYMRQGKYQAAIPLLSQVAQIHENLLRSTSSETRMRSVLSLMRSDEDTLYGLLLQQPTVAALQRLALTTALLRKGRAAEAGTVVNRLVHTGLSDPSLQQRFEQWLQIRQQREAFLYGNPGRLSPEADRAKLTQLNQQADDLESQLAVAMPQLRRIQPPPFETILPAVAARLPSDGVLLEVLWVQPRIFKAAGTEALWASPHYLAMVLSADQKIAVHDLGDAATMDRQVQALLAALRNPGSNPKILAQTLYNQILRPLLPPSARHVYLSMDGTLSLVPFDALHDGQDYLLRRKSFHYLTSGRDLLRTDTQLAKQPALLLADPDFGQGAQSPRTPGTETFYQRLAQLARLPGALREAGFIGKLLSIVPQVGTAATEAVVRLSRAPWVLHIASHGLFLGGEPSAGASGRGASAMGSPWAERKGVWMGDFTTEAPKMNGDSDALSRSALVLAGAAQGDLAKSTTEDGLLTGDEARSLDLQSTQLVVLSACDTGQGDLSIGQGVYGLRRAFLVAGAETLVTSLWQVGDEATGKLMEVYYQKLLTEKKGRLEAMQEAMQQMREKYKHPYYWAPFQVTGSDGPLRPPANLAQR